MDECFICHKGDNLHSITVGDELTFFHTDCLNADINDINLLIKAKSIAHVLKDELIDKVKTDITITFEDDEMNALIDYANKLGLSPSEALIVIIQKTLDMSG